MQKFTSVYFTVDFTKKPQMKVKEAKHLKRVVNGKRYYGDKIQIAEWYYRLSLLNKKLNHPQSLKAQLVKTVLGCYFKKLNGDATTRVTIANCRYM